MTTTVYVYIIENEVYWSTMGEIFYHDTISEYTPLVDIFHRLPSISNVEVYVENYPEDIQKVYANCFHQLKVFPGIDLITDPKRDMLATLLLSALQFHYKYQNIPFTIPEDVMKKLAYIIEIRKHHTF